MEAGRNPNDPFSPQSAVVRNERSLWRDGIVPYIFDSSLGRYFYVQGAIACLNDDVHVYKLGVIHSRAWFLCTPRLAGN